MKPRDSQKITLTIGQLKRLVKESARDMEEPGEFPLSMLDGMSKQKARKTIMRLYSKYSGNHGQLYRDDAWQGVHNIFSTLQNFDINLTYGTKNEHGYQGGYYRNQQGHIAGKEWEWVVSFIDDKDRKTEIKGCLIASYSGTQEQMDSDYLGPDRPYDIIFYAY